MIITFTLSEAKEKAKVRPPEYINDLKAIATRWGPKDFDLDTDSQGYKDLVTKYKEFQQYDKPRKLAPMEMAKGAYHAGRQKLGEKKVPGFNNQAPEEVWKERINICKGCEFSSGKTVNDWPTSCRVCGCGLLSKVKLADMQCPLGSSRYPQYKDLKPKWLKVTVEGKESP